MTRRDRRRLAIALGVIAVLILAAYISFAHRLPFAGHGYEVRAVVRDSLNVQSGDPVRESGVDVGNVVATHPGPGATAILTLHVDDAGRPLHRDATVEIRPRLFLEGSYAVELKPGTPAAPALGDGGTIPLGQTSGPVQIDQVLTTFDSERRADFRRLTAVLARALGRGGSAGLRGAIQAAPPALADVARLAQATRGTRPHDLSGLVSSLSHVSATLASRERQLGDLVTSARRTAGVLASQDATLRAGVRATDAVLRATPPALHALDGALGPLTRFADALRPGLRIAPPVVRDAVATLGQLDAAVQPPELPRFLAGLDPVTRALPGLEDRLDELFPLVTPTSDCLRERVLPVLEAKLDDGALSTGRPVWQDLVHSFASLISGAQSFDANGPWGRYLLGEGSSTATNIPGLGALFGQTGGEIKGARPAWLGPGVTPPFRPDAACRDQTPPDLNTPSVPVGSGG